MWGKESQLQDHQSNRGCSARHRDHYFPIFQVEIPIVNHHICQEAYAQINKKVTRDMICAGEKEGESMGCKGGTH